ncbi:hypothetical protein Tco_1349159 [Tanacetum coccineum]
MPSPSWATRKPSPPCVGRGGPPVGSDKHHQQVWAAMGHLEEDWKWRLNDSEIVYKMTPHQIPLHLGFASLQANGLFYLDNSNIGGI